MENGINENKISGGLTVVIVLSAIQTIAVVIMCVMLFLMHGKIKSVENGIAPISKYYDDIQGYYEDYDYNVIYNEEQNNEYVEEGTDESEQVIVDTEDAQN